MIKRYSEFILEDLNKSKSILKSKLDDYEKLKTFLTSKNALGYMGKFTEFLFNGVPYNELYNLYSQIMELKGKNIRVNINDYDKYESALDDFALKTIDYKFKKIFNQFPKEQKDLFDDPIDKGDKLTISKLCDVENTPFISKISRYKDDYELIKGIERFLDGKLKSFTREYVKSILSDDIKLSFENENILIVQTMNHKGIVEVGSDTSWCIVKGESTFKSYTKENRSQFVVFDYTKNIYDIDFKIGFTVDIEHKILYAHDVLDGSVVPYTKNLLNSNNVKISEILPKLELPDLNNQSTLKNIEQFINMGELDSGMDSKILSILAFKFNRINNRTRNAGSNIIDLVMKLFKKLSIVKGDVLFDKDFDKYKDILGTSYSDIKSKLIDNFILVSKNAPVDIFSSKGISVLLKYYKNWSYKFTKGIYYYIELIDRNIELVDPILHLALKDKSNKDIQLLIEYCKFKKGEKINIENVKLLIDKIDTGNKYKYYNYFGIKYHFNIKSSYFMKSENIIPEDIVLDNPSGYSLQRYLPLLVNCKVTINYEKDDLLEELNKDYKILNGEVSKKSGRYNQNVIMDMVKPIISNLTSKSKKIDFIETTKFPITYKANIKFRKDHTYKTINSDVDIIIK